MPLLLLMLQQPRNYFYVAVKNQLNFSRFQVPNSFYSTTPKRQQDQLEKENNLFN